jgi:hypothetical protein
VGAFIEKDRVGKLPRRDGISVVCYEWLIFTKRLWKNVIAPVAHPSFFKWNRDHVMR